jgi:hypothetical protein
MSLLSSPPIIKDKILANIAAAIREVCIDKLEVYFLNEKMFYSI